MDFGTVTGNKVVVVKCMSCGTEHIVTKRRKYEWRCNNPKCRSLNYT